MPSKSRTIIEYSISEICLFLEFRRLKSDFSGMLDEVTNFLGLPAFAADQKEKLRSKRHNVGLADSQLDGKMKTRCNFFASITGRTMRGSRLCWVGTSIGNR